MMMCHLSCAPIRNVHISSFLTISNSTIVRFLSYNKFTWELLIAKMETIKIALMMCWSNCVGIYQTLIIFTVVYESMLLKMLITITITSTSICRCECCRTNLRFDSENFRLLLPLQTVHAFLPLSVPVCVLSVVILLNIRKIFTKWSDIIIGFINECIFIESVIIRSLFVCISIELFNTLGCKVFSISV